MNYWLSYAFATEAEAKQVWEQLRDALAQMPQASVSCLRMMLLSTGQFCVVVFGTHPPRANHETFLRLLSQGTVVVLSESEKAKLIAYRAARARKGKWVERRHGKGGRLL